MTVPWIALSAVLHWPVAWLIQWRYHRTSFSRALDEYSEQIKCKPAAGSDASHPRNQGLEVLTLRGLWKHFESFFVLVSIFFFAVNFMLILGSECPVLSLALPQASFWSAICTLWLPT